MQMAAATVVTLAIVGLWLTGLNLAGAVNSTVRSRMKLPPEPYPGARGVGVWVRWQLADRGPMALWGSIVTAVSTFGITWLAGAKTDRWLSVLILWGLLLTIACLVLVFLGLFAVADNAHRGMVYFW